MDPGGFPQRILKLDGEDGTRFLCWHLHQVCGWNLPTHAPRGGFVFQENCNTRQCVAPKPAQEEDVFRSNIGFWRCIWFLKWHHCWVNQRRGLMKHQVSHGFFQRHRTAMVHGSGPTALPVWDYQVLQKWSKSIGQPWYGGHARPVIRLQSQDSHGPCPDIGRPVSKTLLYI